MLLQRHGSRVHKGEALRVLQYGDKSSETIHFYMKCGQMKCLSGLEMPGISIYKPSIAFFRVYDVAHAVGEFLYMATKNLQNKAGLIAFLTKKFGLSLASD